MAGGERATRRREIWIRFLRLQISRVKIMRRGHWRSRQTQAGATAPIQYSQWGCYDTIRMPLLGFFSNLCDDRRGTDVSSNTNNFFRLAHWWCVVDVFEFLFNLYCIRRTSASRSSSSYSDRLLFERPEKSADIINLCLSQALLRKIFENTHFILSSCWLNHHFTSKEQISPKVSV